MSRELSPHQVQTIIENAGKVSALAIATAIGCSERTVRQYISDMGLMHYQPGRAAWTRRDWLLAGASGLDFHFPG